MKNVDKRLLNYQIYGLINERSSALWIFTVLTVTISLTQKFATQLASKFAAKLITQQHRAAHKYHDHDWHATGPNKATQIKYCVCRPIGYCKVHKGHDDFDI